MKRNLLKLALCALALLPLGAWAADVTQISSYTLWTFADYSVQTVRVLNYTNGGSEGSGLFLHSTRTGSGTAADPYTYVDFNVNSGRVNATSGTFSNGIAWSASKALTCRRGVTTSYFTGENLSRMSASNETNANNASLAFKATVPGKLYVIYGNTSTNASKFYIRFNNGTDDKFSDLISPVDLSAISTSGDWKYNMQESIATLTESGVVYMGSDNAYCIYAIMFIPTATFNEGEDNTVKSGTYELTINRTLKADVWNPLVLPFAFNKTFMESFAGEGTALASYSSISGTTSSVSLGFSTMDVSSSSTVAGRPYLIKPTTDCTQITYVGEVSATDQSVGRELKDGSTVLAKYTFTRIYSPTVLATTDYYFANESKLKQGNGTAKIKGFRGYMKYTAPASAREFNPDIDFLIDDGENVTSINHIEGLEVVADRPVYNMNGQRISSTTEGLQRGLYIVNGKKYIVK